MQHSWFRKLLRRPTASLRRPHLNFLTLEDRTVPSAWQDLAAIPASPTNASAFLHPEQYRAISIDMAEMRTELDAAPLVFTNADPLVVELPRTDGTTQHFSVVNMPMMEGGLAAEFPEIQTYAGQGIEDPTATLAMDITPNGFHASVRSSSGDWFIDPYYHLETSTYISYFTSDLAPSDIYETRGGVPTGLAYVPPSGVDDVDTSGGATSGPSLGGSSGGTSSNPSGVTLLGRNGLQLRTYRTEISCSHTYAAFYGGTVANALGGITTSLNRINQVYRSELCIQMTLVNNETSVIFTSAASDPFIDDVFTDIDTNQTVADNRIGNSNYDIGHVVSTDPGGGLAGLGVVGIDGDKARGATGLSVPIGDDYDIDYVAHEMGHQYGGDHTFNGTRGSAAGNVNPSTAYEPGSGSTIMAYAGICFADDLQPHSDAMFHSASIDEMVAHVDNVIPSVGTRVNTGNSIPTVSAGSDLTIPANTPFYLTATGNDADPGATLTYSWEERDLGPTQPLGSGDNGTSPRWRTWLPSSNPTRTFPQLSDLVNNTFSPGEAMFTRARTSNFRVTVRDNVATGGGSDFDDMRLNVVNTGAAFAVTAPNTTGISWDADSTQTVTWNVAGTTANGINTANVRILLSTDGGLTYPITILSSTPNDGSESITVPDAGTTKARIRVEAVGNVFFDISNQNFTIRRVVIPATITRDPAQPANTNANPIRFDVVFSDPVIGFDASDILFNAGTITTGLSAFVSPNGGTGDSYFVDVFGATGQGTVGIAFLGGAGFNPGLGLPTEAATTPAGELVRFDNVAPTPLFSPAPIGLTGNPSLPMTVDFGETVTGFDAADLQVVNATVTGFAFVSGGKYQFNLNPGTAGLFSVNIPAGVATDVVGNTNPAAFDSGSYDDIDPIASVTRFSASPSNVAPAQFEVVFTEAVQLPFTVSFNGSTVGGTLVATISPEVGIPNGYIVDVTGMTGQGFVTITVPAGGASDIAGNTTAADAVSNAAVLYDTLPPDVTVTIPNGGITNQQIIPVTIAFSEKVTGFNSFGVLVTGAASKGVVQADPDGKTFTVMLTRLSDGTFDVTIPAAAATDLAGNTSNAGGGTGTFDTVSPFASITRVSASPLIVGPGVFRATFSEPVAVPFTVDTSGSTVGGTLNSSIAADTDPLSPPNSYLISITGMNGEGTIHVSIPAGGVTDLAGNGTLSSTVANADIDFDNLPPSVTISSTQSLTTKANSIPMTAVFSEVVSGFTEAALQTTGSVVVGDFLDTGDGKTFTFTLTRTADGAFTVSIPAGVATDVPGNSNTAGSASGTFDTTRPTVTIVPTAAGFTDKDVVFTVTFSEPLQSGTAFTPDDLVIGGTSHAKAWKITAGANSQTFTVTVSGMTRTGVVTAQVIDAAVNDPAGNASLVGNGTANFTTTKVPPVYLVGTREYVVGTDGADEALAQEFNPDGSSRFTTTTFDGAEAKSVRTGAGDFTRDGVADLVIGSGPGVPSLVQVIDGATGKELLRIHPFESSFLGGVYIAVGDITGDGTPEIVVTPDEGGGPRVQIYRGVDLLKIDDFFGIADTSFRGGARAAIGDMNGDDIGDLIISAGFGGGPRISGYDGAALATGRLSHMFPDFFIFEQSLRNGAFVAAGDVDGDGHADIIAGGGPGGAPRVLILDGLDVILKKSRNPTVIANFYAGDIDNRDGIRVAAKNLDDDGMADVIVGAGSGTQVTAYLGTNLSDGKDIADYSFEAYPGMNGGVFVG